MIRFFVKSSRVINLFILFPLFVQNLSAAKSVSSKRPNLLVLLANHMSYCYLREWLSHHLYFQPDYRRGRLKELDTPELYNLNVDPSEKYDIADQHSDKVAEIQEILKKHLASVVLVENQLGKF